jgi:hypothetical protein
MPAISTTSPEWPELDESPRIEQLPLDDWADQDLLTKQEARERLVEEIGRTRSRLEQLRNEGAVDEGAEVTLLSRRLNAMESTCSEYDSFLGGA